MLNYNVFLSQFLFILGAICCIPLLPILIYQGKRVRDTVPRLPEAPGDRKGIVGPEGKPYRLLTMGESHIAGVGIDSQEEAFTGQIVAQLADELQRPIHWQLLATSGYTVARLDEVYTPQVPETPQDLIIIGMGGNDTFKLNSPSRWVKDFRRLIDNIRKVQPDCPIIIANLPPVGEFPAFPKPLQSVLGGLVFLHGFAARAIPAGKENVYYMKKRILLKDWYSYVPGLINAEAFFSDRVHPSALTFQVWGRVVREFLLDKKILQ